MPEFINPQYFDMTIRQVLKNCNIVIFESNKYPRSSVTINYYGKKVKGTVDYFIDLYKQNKLIKKFLDA